MRLGANEKSSIINSTFDIEDPIPMSEETSNASHKNLAVHPGKSS